jgi:hypothetical protein
MDDLTSMSPISLCFTMCLGLLTIILPRKFAIVPIILSACYMTLGQRVVVISLHFTIFRIMILFGWIRLIGRREVYSIKLNLVDKTVVWWIALSILTGTLLDPTLQRFINRLGFAYNAFGSYFLFRFLIRDFKEICRLLRLLAVLIVPLAIAMLIEKSTGRNVFSVFGVVPEITMVREGHLRCQGPFAHPILAGTFGATLIPLFGGLWFMGRRSRLIAAIGFLSATTIALTPASSGPAMSYIFGILALFLWPLRRRMRLIRWSVVFGLISLHLVMKAPVWYLIARLSDLIGGTGWYRSYLIDRAIFHFSEWWLFGTTYTAHWIKYGASTNPNMVDITNQFILEGVEGGLLKMALFIGIIVVCFRAIGRTLSRMSNQPISAKITLWSMGSALFAHVVSFMSVSYFDQMIVFWFLLLAMISIVSDTSKMMQHKAKNVISAVPAA